MAQQIKNWTSIHEDTGLIPAFAPPNPPLNCLTPLLHHPRLEFLWVTLYLATGPKKKKKKKSGWASGYLLHLIIFPNHSLWEHKGEGCAELKWGLRADPHLGHFFPIHFSSSYLCTQGHLQGGFQFDLKVGSLSGGTWGDIYVYNGVPKAGEGLFPTLPLSKKVFWKIYSGNHLHLSAQPAHPLSHSLFQNSICVPTTCQACGKVLEVWTWTMVMVFFAFELTGFGERKFRGRK